MMKNDHQINLKEQKKLVEILHNLTIEIKEEIKTILLNESISITNLEICQSFRHRGLTEDFSDSLAQVIVFSHILKCLTGSNCVNNTTPFLQCLNSLKPHLRTYNKVDTLSDMFDFTKFDVSHVYEEYIKTHKPELRIKRGIYFTPKPVVEFIINSINYILERHFGLKEGLFPLESNNIYFLDPALGTGTFLEVLISFIYLKYQKLSLNSEKDLPNWKDYVTEQLLTRTAGIELLITPFTIAQLRLTFRLVQTEYGFTADEAKIQIINGNALHRSVYDKNLKLLLDKQPILVILGNPPFSRHSSNTSPWIDDLLHGIDDYNKSSSNYFSVDGKTLEEKNPKWLNDDYVKFLRLSHWLLDQTERGIVAFVLNHSIIDNPTFRGMRQQLINSFTDIYVLDMHGNSRKKELPPAGTIDKNVFDIQQGTCILFLIKNLNRNSPANVFKSDLWGSREEKYHFLQENNIHTVKWEEVKPIEPWYFFYNFDSCLFKEYSRYWKLTDIFQSYSVGIMTGNDSLTIQSSPNQVLNVVMDFISLSEDEFVSKYSIDANRQWTYDKAKNDILKCNIISGTPEKELRKKIQDHIQPILYRPFDIRYTFYTGKSRGFHERPRGKIMQHMINCENIGLIVSKSSKPSPWRDVIVSKNIAELGVIAMRPGNNAPLFPLYLCDTSTKSSKRTNFSISFTDFMHRYSKNNKYNPEVIFHYILAILYSNTYRSRYTEFLKIDFPRIPFPSSREVFEKLSVLGERIKNNLLLKSPNLNKQAINIDINGSERRIEKIKYELPNIIRLNKDLSILNVPKKVFEYYIGSYQVCRKWLKDHQGEELSSDLITTLNKIVLSIQNIIKLTDKIDTVIKESGGWDEVFKCAKVGYKIQEV
ncbi:MAG: type ISP restriction/modification enzyme [Candidatus Hodarchaeales archaeon]